MMVPHELQYQSCHQRVRWLQELNNNKGFYILQKENNIVIETEICYNEKLIQNLKNYKSYYLYTFNDLMIIFSQNYFPK